MGDGFFRNQVKKVLSELANNADVMAYSSSNINHFPYDVDGEKPTFPQEINTKKEYVKDFNTLSSNHDAYEFPIDEFTKGLEIERQKNDSFNILDVAQVVITNLKKNTQFYSGLIS